MSKKFAIIGGDLRTIKLAKILAKEGNIINVYGLEKAEEIKNEKNINYTSTLKEAVDTSDIIIGPVPFTTDNIYLKSEFSDKNILIEDLINVTSKQIFMAGNIGLIIEKRLIEKKIQYYDLMKQEELAILNAISTAEGTIQIMMENTDEVLHNKKVLILGFGRIGKVLAHKLKALSLNVTCSARKKEDLAWIEAYGYNKINTNNIAEELNNYDIIINTIPKLILTKEKLKYVKKKCLLIDLASKPGGIEKTANYIWALALPRKSCTNYISQSYKKHYLQYFRRNIKTKEGIKK